MGINFKINFTTKIKVNGKEYGSPEEVPEPQRQIVKDAMKSAYAPGGHSRISVNGIGYDSPEAMPPDVRTTYEEALKKAEVTAQQIGTPALPGAPVQESGVSLRTTIFLILIVGLALLLIIYTPK